MTRTPGLYFPLGDGEAFAGWTAWITGPSGASDGGTNDCGGTGLGAASIAERGWKSGWNISFDTR